MREFSAKERRYVLIILMLLFIFVMMYEIFVPTQYLVRLMKLFSLILWGMLLVMFLISEWLHFRERSYRRVSECLVSSDKFLLKAKILGLVNILGSLGVVAGFVCQYRLNYIASWFALAILGVVLAVEFVTLVILCQEPKGKVEMDESVEMSVVEDVCTRG